MGSVLETVLRTTSCRHRPWQLAMAVALGVAIGFLPKTSMMFLVGCTVCAILPIHLPLAGLAGLLVSLWAPAVEVALGRVGLWSLTHPHVSPLWFRLDSLPWVPWLGMHNTVVHGGVLVGLGLLLPIFICTLPAARRLCPRRIGTGPLDAHFAEEMRAEISLLCEPLRFTQQIDGTELERNQTESVTPKCLNDVSALPVAATTCRPDMDGSLDEAASAQESIGELKSLVKLEELLSSCREDGAADASVEDVVQRAMDIAHHVDELLADFDRSLVNETQMTHASPASLNSTNEYRLVHERKILSQSTLDKQTISLESLTRIAASSEVEQEETRIEVRRRVDGLSHTSLALSASSSLVNAAESATAAHDALFASQEQVSNTYLRPAEQTGIFVQQEQLRYLLHHLKALKDKV